MNKRIKSSNNDMKTDTSNINNGSLTIVGILLISRLSCLGINTWDLKKTSEGSRYAGLEQWFLGSNKLISRSFSEYSQISFCSQCATAILTSGRAIKKTNIIQ